MNSDDIIAAIMILLVICTFRGIIGKFFLPNNNKIGEID